MGHPEECKKWHVGTRDGISCLTRRGFTAMICDEMIMSNFNVLLRRLWSKNGTRIRTRHTGRRQKKKSTFGAVSVSSERIFHEYRQFDS